jgi:hypothetical protein
MNMNMESWWNETDKEGKTQANGGKDTLSGLITVC